MLQVYGFSPSPRHRGKGTRSPRVRSCPRVERGTLLWRERAVVVPNQPVRRFRVDPGLNRFTFLNHLSSPGLFTDYPVCPQAPLALDDRSRYEALDRRFRHPQPAANLGVRQLVNAIQDEYGASPRLHVPNGSFDDRKPLPGR